MKDDEKQKLLQDVRRYLKAHLIPADTHESFVPPFLGAASIASLDVRSFQRGRLSGAAKDALLHGLQKMLQPGFRDLLFDFIKKKGIRNADLYHRSDITKAHFSKIKNDKDYHPSKETVLALALGLKLTLDETKTLLARAGYTLTDSSRTDLIVTYFIRRQIYDVNEVNDILSELGLPTITNHKQARERKDDW